MTNVVIPENIIGNVYSKLKVIKYVGSYYATKKGHLRHMFLCQCECGNTIVAEYDRLRSGGTTNCGCYTREKRAKAIAERSATHHMSNTRIYGIYHNMIQRCYNPKDLNYIRYGGRGIYVCDEWYQPGVQGSPGFINFVQWSYKNGYYDQANGIPRKDYLTIDRIDNDGPYAPWNCRWVTNKEQNLNKSTTTSITDLDDKTLTHSEFEIKHNLRSRYVPNHLKANWSVNAILYSVYSGINITRRGGSRWYGWYYYNDEGFRILIPSFERQKEMFGFV